MTRRNRRGRRLFTRKSSQPPLPGTAICHPRLAISGKTGPRKRCLDTKTRRMLQMRSRRGGSPSHCKPDDEICLVDSAALTEKEKKELKESFFRPEMPAEWLKDPDAWLTDRDIRDVMKQYEEAYPHFKFLGVAPIDFSAPDPYTTAKGKCVVDTFCHVNLAELAEKGKTILAAVFNLDPHYKGGSHWVSLVINPKGVYYFDSYGLPPPEQIARFMRSFRLQNPELELANCGRRFQYGNSECGMYSLYFVIQMIRGYSFKKFCKHSIPDSWMLKFRSILFRKPDAI